MAAPRSSGKCVPLVLDLVGRCCLAVTISALLILPATDVDIPMGLIPVGAVAVLFLGLGAIVRRRMTAVWTPARSEVGDELEEKLKRRQNQVPPARVLRERAEVRRRKAHEARWGPRWMRPHITRRNGAPKLDP